jgi:signal transduction histidine kinase
VPPGPQVDDDLDELDRTISGAFHVTQQLLTLGRAGRGERTIVDVHQVITAAEGTLRRAIGSGVALRFQFEARTPHVLADPYELEWLLLNLVINGEAVPDGGELSIGTFNHAPASHNGAGAFVRLTVSDTRESVPAASGAIARAISVRLVNLAVAVENLNGRLEIERQEGHGTIVHVDLPVASGSA